MSTDEHTRQPTSSASTGSVERVRRGDQRTDRLVREEPLLIVAGDSQLLTMRTPGDDRALVTGFLLSEGAVTNASDIINLDLRAAAAQTGRDPLDEVHVDVAGRARARLAGRLTRTHEVRSSCGVCGLSDPSTILDDTPPLLTGVPRIEPPTLQSMRTQLLGRQALFRETGACHAAGIFGSDGKLWAFAEDVGRHNALDKAFGYAIANGFVLDRAVVLLSGRAGYDLVVKCLRLRVPVIASVSAPSALSFDLCDAAGATLIGFLREGRMEVYTDDSGRITSASQ